MTVRAWRIVRYGSPEQAYRLDEIEVTKPAAGDLVVRVLAASINPIDLKLAEGALRPVLPLRFPALAGFDLAGVVEDVGTDVAKFKAGDLVYARADRLRRGAFAEKVAIQADAVAAKPRALDFVAAAALPLVALTTMQALVDRAHAKAGQRVLIHAGSGGVGTIAIQYAKLLDLDVTTTASSKNAAWVRALGADRVIEYDRESYLDRGDRYDIVFDTLGGPTTLESFRVVRPGGVVVSIAGPPDAEMADAVGAGSLVRAAMWLARRRVESAAHAAEARYFRFLTESRGSQLAELSVLVDAGRIRPVIDSTFPFDRAQEGFARVASGHSKGKVVLVLDG